MSAREPTSGLSTRLEGIVIRGGNAGDGLGGGVLVDRVVAQLIDCVVTENRAASGGGVSATLSDLLIEGCLIEGNIASGAGGGIRSEGSSLLLIDTRVVANRSGDHGGGVEASNTLIDLVRSEISMNDAMISGGGLRLDAASFVLAEDHRLCGNTPDDLDIAGEVAEPPRPGPLAGDLDGDGVVGSGDLALLLAAWGVCEGCGADLDGDGEVGGGDLTLLMSAWMAGVGGGS